LTTTFTRVGSSLSILGCIYILVTRTAFPAFRTPANRLVSHLAVADILAHVGTLIARDAFINHGPNSALCQSQALTINWFFLVDAFLNASMALGLLLIIVFRLPSDRVRGFDPYLKMASWGTPGVVSICYLVVGTEGRGKIYGDATLWCWISDEYSYLRIATYHGPIWVTILFSFFVY
ncbi:hypothetical protein BDK51DRAFT_8140, partial [Blyttiomyces helicus]